MPMNILRRILLGGLLLALPLIAQAHTALRESVPANEATLTAAPESLQLTFNGPVRLIKLELMADGKPVATEFKAPSEPVATYEIPAPNLTAGSFTVNWAAIGEDGHTVSNSFSFVVTPGVASAGQ